MPRTAANVFAPAAAGGPFVHTVTETHAQGVKKHRMPGIGFLQTLVTATCFPPKQYPISSTAMNDSASLFIAATLVFVLAGCVKGVVGMGLPTLVMGALGLMMPPVEAAALLVAPALVTNLWQLFTGPSFSPLLKRLGVMMGAVCIGTPVGIGFLTASDLRWPTIALGTVLTAYALVSVWKPTFSVATHVESKLSPAVGLATGVLTGATGVFVVPAAPYLSVLGMTRDELIQALGLSFTVSTLALAACLALSGNYATAMAGHSVTAVIPALIGMVIGQKLRHKLDPEFFRRCFFGTMFALGVLMIARAVTLN